MFIADGNSTTMVHVKNVQKKGNEGLKGREGSEERRKAEGEDCELSNGGKRFLTF